MSEFNLEDYLQKLQKSTSIDDCPKAPTPKIEKDQNYIFVSYSHKDYKKVYYDLAHLYCRGVRFWYDKGLSAGEDWENEVKEHIQSPCCCGVIFYISSNMFLSGSIFKEIEFTTAKKKPNVILQKNYFCVNLESGNISDILFDVQTIQRNEGIARFDTKRLNTLTSTFSDDDTYIKYNSIYHIDELVEQIQNKFDVTNKAKNGEPTNILALEAINTPRLALIAFNQRETDPIPLFKYLYSDYKKTKTIRPWSLLVIATVLALIATSIAIYLLFTTPDIPLLSKMSMEYDVAIVACNCLVVPCFTAKTFWLFYVSPINRNREKGIVAKVVHCIVYFLATLALAALGLVVVIVSAYLTFLLFDYLMKKLAI